MPPLRGRRLGAFMRTHRAAVYNSSSIYVVSASASLFSYCFSYHIYIFTSSFANTLPLDPDDIMTAHAIKLPYDANSDYTISKAIYKADKNLFASHSNYESELQHSPSLNNLETEKQVSISSLLRG